MIGPILFIVAGACLAAKAKAKAKVRKHSCIGTVSGEIYDVEEFPEHCAIFVTSKDGGTKLTYTRDPQTGAFLYLTGTGNQEVASTIRKDIEGERLSQGGLR